MTFNDALAMGANYTWGPIDGSYSVGPYDILRYRTTDGYMLYHAFLDGEDTNHSFNTLDEAIAGVIAYRAEGPNCQAGKYFIRSLRPQMEQP